MRRIAIDSITNVLMFFYILSLYILTYREGLNTISNALALMLIVTIWIGIVLSTKKLVFTKLLFVQLLFVFICFVTAFYAIDQNTVIAKVRTLVLIYIVMLSIVNYIDSFDKANKILEYFVYSGVVSSIYILATSDFSQIIRFGGELGNQNAVGMNLSISSIFCFYIIVSKKKYWYTLFFVLMIPCILLTGSRKALIFILISIILISYLRNRNSLSKIVKFIAICICVLLVFYYLIFYIPLFYEIIGERIENMFSLFSGEGTNEGSINIRYNMAKVGLDLFANRPLAGYGIDNYRYLYAGTYSHNNFIELMVGTGILGVIIYYLTHIIVLKELLRARKCVSDKTLCYVIIVLIVSYIILSPSLVYYYDKNFNILLAVGSAIGRIVMNKKVNITVGSVADV